MTLVVNLYGGPGTGKSTTAAALFAILKQDGINAELVTEYAKDRVWDDHHKCLEDQLYILGKQYHRIHRLLNKVQVIVTDAPILLSAFYGENSAYPAFVPLVKQIYGGLNNMDIFLRRVKPYNPSGRMQTEDGAKEIDVKLKEMLDKFDVLYYEQDADREAAINLAGLVHTRRMIELIDNQPLPSREEIFELGKLRPFDKFVTFPIEVTCGRNDGTDNQTT